MALRKIKNRYYIYYRDQDGKLRTLSLGTSDPAKAQIEHDRMMAIVQSAKVASKLLNRHAMLFPESVAKEMEQSNPIPPRIPREKKRLKLKDMLDVARQYRDISPDTERSLERFVEWCGNDIKYACDVTPQVAIAYLNEHFSGGNGRTFNNNKSALNTVFRCCLVQAQMERSPFECFPNRKIRNIKSHRPLTNEEFIRAFNAAREPWKTASLISWHTALRREACFRLAWEHINVEDKSITILPGKTARFGRAVYIPIHEELWEWLTQMPRPKDNATPILSQFRKIRCWDKNKNISYYVGLLQSVGVFDTQAGKASFHSLRSSFITRCDENGVSRTATKGIAGQRNDNITDLYSHDHQSARQILTLPAVGVKLKSM